MKSYKHKSDFPDHLQKHVKDEYGNTWLRHPFVCRMLPINLDGDSSIEVEIHRDQVEYTKLVNAGDYWNALGLVHDLFKAQFLCLDIEPRLSNSFRSNIKDKT